MIGPLRSIMGRALNKPPRQLAQAAVRRLATRVAVDELDFPLRVQDVWDSGRSLPAARPLSVSGRPARIAWVVVPPAIGSGGHTTLFRMVQAAHQEGLENTVVFYDRYHGDFRTNVSRLRAGWPWLHCDVIPMPSSLEGFDLCVASSWPTAHVVASRSRDVAIARAYFIQDFEPYFYPRGTLYALAEDTYRFGLCNLALGEMVHATLAREVGVESELVPFGSDRTNYHLLGDVERRAGVVFFAKVGNDRRGYLLSILALREFQASHPQVPIHVYGDHVREEGLRVTNYGYLAPDALNRLYNTVTVGLILSFTNVSLIPAELTAAGVTPVLNDYPGARKVFDHPLAIWAPPTPTGLARALSTALDTADKDHQAVRLASWHRPTWDSTSHAVVRAIGRLLSD